MHCGVVHVDVYISFPPLHPHKVSKQDNHIATIASLQTQIKSLKSDTKRNKNIIQSLEMDLANATGDLLEKDSREDELALVSGLEDE